MNSTVSSYKNCVNFFWEHLPEYHFVAGSKV